MRVTSRPSIRNSTNLREPRILRRSADILFARGALWPGVIDDGLGEVGCEEYTSHSQAGTFGYRSFKAA